MSSLGLEEEDETDGYNSEELETHGNDSAEAALALIGLSTPHNSSSGSKQVGATSTGTGREFNVIASPLTTFRNAVGVGSNLNRSRNAITG